MSGNDSSAVALRLSNTGIFRYAIGSMAIMMVAMGADYTLAYLTPILSLNFLTPGTKKPGIKLIFVFLFSVASSIITSLIFTRSFLEYPLVFIPLMTLILFLIFYTDKLQPMKLWLMISLLLIPLISMKAPSSGIVLAGNLFINAALAIILVSVIWLLFPEKEFPSFQQKKNIPKQTSGERFLSGTVKTLIVAPVVLLFFVFGWTDSILTLIFIAVLSMNPATSNKKAGLGIILANLGGGIAAIIAFNLLSIVPDFLFFGLLVLLAGLFFGNKLFSTSPLASLYGMAFSTFLLILGNVTSIAGEAADKVYSRLFQIGLAVIYIVTAFQVADLVVKSLRKTES